MNTSIPAQIQSDERVHLELLGQTLDGHDLDLLRIGASLSPLETESNPNMLQPPAYLCLAASPRLPIIWNCIPMTWRGTPDITVKLCSTEIIGICEPEMSRTEFT